MNKYVYVCACVCMCVPTHMLYIQTDIGTFSAAPVHKAVVGVSEEAGDYVAIYIYIYIHIYIYMSK